MARFAAECRVKMRQVVNELATTLGPDTEELTMRLGLHSGPVIAGVLRGDRARFQLFGDTVNTTARIEVCSPFAIRKGPDAPLIMLTLVSFCKDNRNEESYPPL